ncbi:MAG: family 10 glycosylhydrolase [Kiritimatiellae bacterium]|nr:family 10 glycosylhydrolase [Kiritimatiellia bacterium]
MRKILLFSVFLLFAITFEVAAADAVLLVKATSSAKDASERGYAASLTKRLDRWLTASGVRTKVVDDDSIAKYAAEAKVIVLGYNPDPSATELRVLQDFIKRGGKLIVFYSSSAKLASMMGFTLGNYKASPLGGKWSEIRAVQKLPLHIPSSVFQESRNIKVVMPGSRQSRVIAFWANSTGAVGQDPALLQSPAGFWMTHVLLDDGDTGSKRKMLLGLIASCDTAVWKPAARKCVKDLDEKLAIVVAEGSAAKKVSKVWRKDREYLDLLMTSAKYAESVKQADIVFELSMRAYAKLQKPVKGEFRGVWDHTGLGLYPSDWGKTCAILKKSGMTDIFSNVLWAGLAHFPSKLTPNSDMVQLRGDQLQESIKAAHRAGLRLHAWKVCWNLVQASPEFVKEMTRAGRLQVDDTGKVKNWLCPSNAENVKMELAAIREMVQGYDVDGIHLDYIRYPNSHYCYCAVCRKNFEKHIGRKVSMWPAAARSGMLKMNYSHWRTLQMTGFVQDVAQMIDEVKPSVKLSAAVYGKYPLCGLSVGQDWGSWLKRDIVDFVCPMNYSKDMGKFSALVKDQVALPHSKGKIFPGIGVTATESHLDEFDVIKQIKVSRNYGARGFVLFSLNRELEKEILPALRRGITGQ